MAVHYTLRDPNAPIPYTPQERLADQPLVKSFVVLKADRGSGAELVDQIRNLAGLQTFHDPRIVTFCDRYKVTTENDKKALRNLFNVLRERSLVLDFQETLDVNRVNPPQNVKK